MSDVGFPAVDPPGVQVAGRQAHGPLLKELLQGVGDVARREPLPRASGGRGAAAAARGALKKVEEERAAVKEEFDQRDKINT